MAAVQVSKTPSPPPRVRTPQTPKFGAFGDNWEPYSPRKSARIANRTPSPQTSTTASRNTTSRKSTFSTPAGSPQKKRAPAMDSVIRASRANAPAATSSADSLGIGSSKSQPRTTAGMLPTPAKTPRKQPDEKFEAGVRAVARNLFAGESSTSEAVASPRKRKAKTYTGVSLESFRAEEIEEEIPIFTDSRDRLPEVDDSAANPFYGNTAEDQQPSTRRSSRVKKVLVPGHGRIPVDEAVQRGDGIVYVFRGKSFWKPREDGNCGDDENRGGDPSADGEALALPSVQRSGSPPRRSTRSSIKPRLLFPPQEEKQISHDTDEEEAATDIEDHIITANADTEEPQIETPDEVSVPDTPAAPRFAPASPPTTGRATRVSKRLIAEATPVKHTGRRSPFDSWKRSKTGAAPHGQKREAESSLEATGASKRLRA
ncbi:hypothetical protein SUNI508_02875 [Seiridium unicorne]|uniref:Uncharacterized protein n=1 Tax=Seiridium unicorne TaxID=138068 RepID=A0ABR2VIW5_9PEZI